MAVLSPDEEVDLVVKALALAIALAAASPGADVDSDPRNADVGANVVLAVDVDAVAAPGAGEVGCAVTGDPDRRTIVEVQEATGPGAVVEDCNSSSERAIADVRVESGAQDIATPVLSPATR